MTCRPCRGSVVALTVLLLGLAAAAGSITPVAAQEPQLPETVRTDPPPNAPEVTARWLRVDPGDGSSQLIAVLRPPKAKGPFPALIYLHGGSGLGGVMVEQAAAMARKGFVVVVGCWLPNAPDDQWSEWCAHPPDPGTALANLEAVTRAQRGIRKDRIGVLGLSSGAGAVFNYQWGPSVLALAVDSGFGRTQTGEFSVDAAAPVLLLIGTENETFPVEIMHQFEAALLANGVTVESEYYEGGKHVVTLCCPGSISQSANARLIKFFKKRLT